MNIGTAAEQLAEQISELGVPTTANPTELVIPGAWLTVRRIEANRLAGAGEAEWTLYLIAGDHELPTVLDELGELYGLVSELAMGEAEFVQLALPNYAANGLPALAVTIHTEISEASE